MQASNLEAEKMTAVAYVFLPFSKTFGGGISSDTAQQRRVKNQKTPSSKDCRKINVHSSKTCATSKTPPPHKGANKNMETSAKFGRFRSARHLFMAEGIFSTLCSIGILLKPENILEKSPCVQQRLLQSELAWGGMGEPIHIVWRQNPTTNLAC